jgi:hypothetical protein
MPDEGKNEGKLFAPQMYGTALLKVQHHAAHKV